MELKAAPTDMPEADALEKKAWLYGKMSDDLLAQAAQIRFAKKYEAKAYAAEGTRI